MHIVDSTLLNPINAFRQVVSSQERGLLVTRRVLRSIAKEVSVLSIGPVGELVVGENDCLFWCRVDSLNRQVSLDKVLKTDTILFESCVGFVVLVSPHDEFALKIVVDTHGRNSRDARDS